MDKLIFDQSMCPREEHKTVSCKSCLDCNYCFGFDEEGLLICTYDEIEEE